MFESRRRLVTFAALAFALLLLLTAGPASAQETEETTTDENTETAEETAEETSETAEETTEETTEEESSEEGSNEVSVVCAVEGFANADTVCHRAVNCV